MPEGYTWTEVAAHGGAAVLVVPIGSYEQHGPHLPLDTDTQIACALGGAASERAEVRGRPAGRLRCERGARRFPRHAVDRARRAGRGAGRDRPLGAPGVPRRGVRLWARRQRRGAGPGRRALVPAEGDAVFCWAPAGRRRRRARRPHRDVAHARHQSRRRPPRARFAPGATEPWRASPAILRREGVRAVSPNGVLGDPGGATAAEGEQLLAALAERPRGQLSTAGRRVADRARPRLRGRHRPAREPGRRGHRAPPVGIGAATVDLLVARRVVGWWRSTSAPTCRASTTRSPTEADLTALAEPPRRAVVPLVGDVRQRAAMDVAVATARRAVRRASTPPSAWPGVIAGGTAAVGDGRRAVVRALRRERASGCATSRARRSRRSSPGPSRAPGRVVAVSSAAGPARPAPPGRLRGVQARRHRAR